MRRTKAQAEETRQAILEAAERKFLMDGVSKTSLEQIAAEAGVTRGAIYWHFKNKAELFRALKERTCPKEKMLEQALAEGTHSDLLGLLRDSVLDSLSQLVEDEQRQRIYMILVSRCEYVGEMLEALAEQCEAQERLHNRLLVAFRQAEERGLLSPDWTPETATNSFIYMLEGMVVSWLKFGKRFDLMEVVTPAVQTLFRCFRRAPAEAGRASSLADSA